MKSSTKIILIAASVFSFVLFLGIGFYVFSSGKVLYNKAESDMQSTLKETPNWEKYAGRIVLGTDIKYLVEQDEAFYRVITVECPYSFCQFSGISDATSEHYVDPADKFICSTISNQEGESIGLQFIEVGLRDTDRYSQGDLVSQLRSELNSLLQKEQTIDREIEEITEKIRNSSEGSESQQNALKSKQEHYESLLERKAELCAEKAKSGE